MSIKDIDEEVEMGYNESLGNSSRVRVSSPVEETPTMVVRNNNNINVNNNDNTIKVMYKECLKNHAISHCGHALDGCCEFLPAGPEGSLDALKCAACNCHRNFHRKEAHLLPNDVSVVAPVPATGIPARDAYPPYNHHHHQAAPPPHYTVYRIPEGLLHVTALSGGGPSALAPISLTGGGGGVKDHNDATDTNNGGIGSISNSKKRFRTKFTPEQKEKMKAFAERLNWRIHKQDHTVVQEFCNENNVKHQVLKVWVHNNKHTIGKKP